MKASITPISLNSAPLPLNGNCRYGVPADLLDPLTLWHHALTVPALRQGLKPFLLSA